MSERPHYSGNQTEQSFVIRYDGKIFVTLGAWVYDPHEGSTEHLHTVENLLHILGHESVAPIRPTAIDVAAQQIYPTRPGNPVPGPHMVDIVIANIAER